MFYFGVALGFIFGGVAGYLVALNRNQAYAKAQIAALEKGAGDEIKAVLARVKEFLRIK